MLGAAQYNGVPSNDLRARLDHALALWREHIAPIIVVTGGKEPGDRYTEAATGAMYLHARGVPQSAILREVQGRSSWESLEAAARFLQERHLRRVTLVSDAYHSARIADIAADVGLDPVTSPTHFIRGIHILPYLFRESVRVGAGRLIGYGVLQRHGRVGKLLPGLAIMVVPPPAGCGTRAHAHSGVVQLAERLTLDQKVGGSSPPPRATTQSSTHTSAPHATSHFWPRRLVA